MLVRCKREQLAFRPINDCTIYARRNISAQPTKAYELAAELKPKLSVCLVRGLSGSTTPRANGFIV